MNQSNSVHPSRASFVPQSRPTASSFDPPRQRSRSPPPHRRSRSPPPHQRRASPSHDRRASPSYESYDRVESRRADDQEREEERRRRERDEMRRERERRDGEREERGLERERRATPERGLGGGRGGYGGGMGRGGGGAGGGEDWFESRRKERDNSAVTIWPPSPRAPERAVSPSGKKSSSKKHRSSKSRRRRDSPSSSDSSSDSEDDRRRSKKHKHRHTKSSKPKSSRRDERERSRSVEQRVVVRKEDEGDEDEDEDMWVEKPSAVVVDEGDEEVGPLPLFVPGQKGGRNSYGGALLKGEGSAMAAFVAEGERIPRRGEIGMESDEIERFEQIGYVMSGSRHRRMNAVRVRKENQVISAEEKRGILKMQAEEKAKRENQIVASFKELVDTRLAKK